jgi:hypothetical protein
MKHILNDLTEKEKNSIREQHTGGMKVVTENFSKLINAKSGDVKPLVNEDETSFGRKIKRGLRKVGSIFNQNKFIAEDLLSDYVNSGKITEEDRDQIMSDISEMLSEINPYPYEENRESLVHDLVMKAVRIHKSNKENESSVNEQRGDDESLIDCEQLFLTMEFIFNDFMDSISTSPDEIESEDAEGIYDDFEIELTGIIDLAYRTECDYETLQELEIMYNEYLSEMADKLGLQ